MSARPDEAAEFDLGVRQGTDPRPAPRTTGSGVAMTQTGSEWSYRYCATCGHTFRRGDRVLLSDPARVHHLVPGLNCGIDPRGGGEEQAADEARSFAEGLLSAWPPHRGTAVVALAADDWRIPRPGGPRPPVCLFCAHTFRPGELVVVCPCRPGGTAQAGRVSCGAAVHRDPAAGLPCWERWRPAGEVTVCPVTKARV